MYSDTQLNATTFSPHLNITSDRMHFSLPKLMPDKITALAMKSEADEAQKNFRSLNPHYENSASLYFDKLHENCF